MRHFRQRRFACAKTSVSRKTEGFSLACGQRVVLVVRLAGGLCASPEWTVWPQAEGAPDLSGRPSIIRLWTAVNDDMWFERALRLEKRDTSTSPSTIYHRQGSHRTAGIDSTFVKIAELIYDPSTLVTARVWMGKRVLFVGAICVEEVIAADTNMLHHSGL